MSGFPTLLRIRCEYKTLDPLRPYDQNQDGTSYGTGFVVEWEGERFVLVFYNSFIATLQRSPPSSPSAVRELNGRG